MPTTHGRLPQVGSAGTGPCLGVGGHSFPAAACACAGKTRAQEAARPPLSVAQGGRRGLDVTL